MERGWERNKNVLAERFGKDEIPGFLKKEFVAKGNEFVVLEKDGEIYIERGAGKLVISSFGETFTDIILVDKSEKTIETCIKNFCLADGGGVGIKITLKFRIFNSDHMSKNLMGERGKLFAEDVGDQLMSDVLCRDVLPKLQKKRANDFLKEDHREKTKSDIEAAVKRKFREWGLILTSASVDFVMQTLSSEASECSETQKTGEELSGLEKERLEKEVRMTLDKKQMQRDMEDALEAIRLKDVKKKERNLDEAESENKLNEELETLKKAKEITERKFYKKELSEESFQRMMEDFEKRIIEIETRLKRK